VKKAIVVGASSGMGRELAKILAANNYKVGVVGRRLSLLKELANEKPDLFVVRSFDISDVVNVAQNIEELVAELGGLDLLVICSGVVKINKELDFEPEKVTLNTNVFGFTFLVDWTFNYFEKQKFGHLVGVSSLGGIKGWRDTPAYNASKAYQINYLEGLRNKAFHSKLPITITEIRPGYVDTAMAVGSYQFWIQPTVKAARQIFKAIVHKKKVAYVTKRWRIIGFLMKMIPIWLQERA
jgi:short-subunit dehydrogenase